MTISSNQILRLVILLPAALLLAACGTANGGPAPTTSAASPTANRSVATETPAAATTVPTNTAISPTAITEPTATSVPPTAATLPAATTPPTATALPPLSGSGGGVIAFVSEQEGVPGIHIMNADGSDQRRQTDAFDAHPTWSPDGSQIAFSTRPSDVVAISVIDLASGAIRQLTDTERSPSAPDWSSDGQHFAMIFNPAHPGIDYELYLMGVGGSGFEQLTDSAGYQYFDNPDWSPDGSKLAFSADLEGNFDIYGSDADGSNAIQLTTNEADERSPVWSPDGSKIAFESYRDGNWEIVVMNADGSGVQNISNSPDSREQWPSWSPDGSKIAFQTDRDGNWEIYIMNADGTEPQRLTDNDVKDTEPAWRPQL